jgi:hypothetical protein
MKLDNMLIRQSAKTLAEKWRRRKEVPVNFMAVLLLFPPFRHHFVGFTVAGGNNLHLVIPAVVVLRDI